MNSQDEYGATLLNYSLQSGHTEISKFLVISEADVNIMDKEELTPLDWAHWMNQVETAKIIIFCVDTRKRPHPKEHLMSEYCTY